MTIIRAMTFNIANGLDTEDDGENAWQFRAPLNVATMRRYAPDLIGFQQLDDGNLETYQHELPDYSYTLGVPSDELDHPSYNAIFWNANRLQLMESGGFYLSETPDRWSLGWDATYVKSINWARFSTSDGGDTFLHLNTHFEHIGETSRVESVRLVLGRMDELRKQDLPVIFTGDFNCNPWSPGYRVYVETTFTDRCYHMLRAYGFADAFLEAGGEDSPATFTFHGFEGDRYWAARHHMAGRIDWILTLDGTRRILTRSYVLVRDHASQVYPSDHYPVVADLELTS